MAISSIFISSFRNHQEKKINFCKGLTVIWGENGSGKTSVLEAIHTLSLGKSFRTHMQKTLIKNGEDGFLIKGRFLSKKKRERNSNTADKKRSAANKDKWKENYNKKEPNWKKQRCSSFS